LGIDGWLCPIQVPPCMHITSPECEDLFLGSLCLHRCRHLKPSYLSLYHLWIFKMTLISHSVIDLSAFYSVALSTYSRARLTYSPLHLVRLTTVVLLIPYLQTGSQKLSFHSLFSITTQHPLTLYSSFGSYLVTSTPLLLLRLPFFSSPRLLPFSTSLLSLDVDAEFHPLGIQTLTLSVPRLASSLTVAVSSNTHNHNFV
jgi:hypothetical protein